MYMDLPKITRCCFCIPLRYGLQVWGYVKLLLEMAFLSSILLNTSSYLLENMFNSPLAFVLLILITDIIFSIFLVIATHKKHEKLFEFYCMYCKVVLILMMSGFIVAVVFIAISLSNDDHDVFLYGPIFWKFITIHLVLIAGLIVLQGYIILLVRTELHKLRDNSNIQFYNHAGEPQVDMTIEKIVISA